MHLSTQELQTILIDTKTINLSFDKPYVVPVRGDSRYSLVASILISSADITKLREKMKLKLLYSEGRPLRYTFGVVRNEATTETE